MVDLEKVRYPSKTHRQTDRHTQNEQAEAVLGSTLQLRLGLALDR